MRCEHDWKITVKRWTIYECKLCGHVLTEHISPEERRRRDELADQENQRMVENRKV